MEYTEAYVSLNMLISNEPAYDSVYADILEYCAEAMWEDEAAEYADTLTTSVRQVQSGSSLINVLIRRGGIDRTILVDGELYEGTLEQLQADESVPDEAEIEIGIQTTQAGLDVAKAFRQANSIEALFEDRPQYKEGFLIVLRECEKEGRSTKELQSSLQAAGVIAAGFAQSQELHASYFTGKLEQIGALAWDGDSWRTTPKGSAVL